MSPEDPLLSSSISNDPMPRRKTERLMSLDVLRGATIALMIFVDFCGESTPAVDHSAWDGVRLADFVMPSFDFIVGVSLVMSMQGGRLKSTATSAQLKTALYRSLKLFVIGMLTQAGTDFPTYDLKHLRIMGILQRVSLCYLVVSFSEILLPKPTPLQSMDKTLPRGIHSDVFFQRRWHWVVAVVLVIIHSCLIYGIDDGCGLGTASPKCNGASYIDRQILGVNHMYFPTNGGAWEYKEMTFQRTPDCSTCAPGRCAPPPDAPEWCGYDSLKGGHAFDPEGIVSSLTAVVAPIFGAHCGAASVLITDHRERLKHWGVLGLGISVLGLVIHAVGLPLNTDLYSLSYLLLSTGVAVMVLCLCYYLVDYLPSLQTDNRRTVHPLLKPFHWLGLNSILIYLLSCTGIAETVLTLVYWNDPDHNMSHLFFPTGKWWGVDEGGDFIPEITHYPAAKSAQICCWCLFFYIPVWMILAGYLHSIKWYLKI